MSVYKPKGTPYYHYDFQLRGRRFHGSTECEGRRAAEGVERTRRAEAAKRIEQDEAQRGAPMSFQAAASRYWLEVGQHHRGRENTLWSLEWLEREIGAGTLVRDIRDGLVASVVAKRRGDGVRPATVNRSVTEPLRKVLNRAARVWEQHVPAVRWRDHMLREPRERVRELTADEEARLFAHLRADYHPVVRFALLTGCRLSECVGLRWPDVDWGGRVLWINGKGGKRASIPLPPTVREVLWPLQGHHDELVFTYEAVVSRDGRRKGQREPITIEGLKTTFKRALMAAEIAGYRFHDNRHTAATRVLRSGGNLRIVQKMLRHERIDTTTKYAHVTSDDIMDAMEKAAQPTRSPERTPEVADPIQENSLQIKASGE